MRLNVRRVKAHAGARFIVHLGRTDSDFSLCGRRMRVEVADAPGFECRVCRARAASVYGVIYVIHFDRPLQHARHYIGWTRDWVTFKQRMSHHRSGNGAKLMKAVSEAGIEWRVTATYYADRNEERRMKKNHGASRFCDACRAGTVAA